MTFCGYIQSTHLGIVSRIDGQVPVMDHTNARALLWLGETDDTITPAQTRASELKFSSANRQLIASTNGGHAPPDSDDPTFVQVQTWISSLP